MESGRNQRLCSEETFSQFQGSDLILGCGVEAKNIDCVKEPLRKLRCEAEKDCDFENKGSYI